MFNKKCKMKMKKNTGITLVALVVTIVVLLILAGITINLILGPNSIFNNAKEAKDKTETGTFEEKLGMVYTDAMIKKGQNGKLTPEEYFEILKNHEIISDLTVPGGNIAEPTENEDGSKIYKITSDDDYIFEVIIYPDGKVETEVIGKDGNVEAKIKSILVTNKTKDSISIRVSTRLQGGTVKAYYKKLEDVAENEPEDSTDGYTEIILNENLEGTVSGLTEGKEYKIKVILEKDGKIANSKSINITTGRAVSSITLNKTEASVELRKELKLEATVKPDNAENKEIEWISSDETIATVDQEGKVTGIRDGETIITVISKDISSVRVECKVKVETNWEKLAKIAKEIAEGRGKDENNVEVNRNSLKATVTIEENNETIQVGQEFYVKHNEIVRKVRILGFNHDTLTNPKIAYGNETSATTAGISFEFVEFMIDETKQMHPTDSDIIDWASTEMRTYLEGDEGIGKIGQSCRKNIKQVNKAYIKIFNDKKSVINSADKLWLLSCSEIWTSPAQSSGPAFGYAIEKEGEQYKYFGTKASSSDLSSCLKKGVKYGLAWWLRSPYYYESGHFCYVGSYGDACGYNVSGWAKNFYYVAPGFCI